MFSHISSPIYINKRMSLSVIIDLFSFLQVLAKKVHSGSLEGISIKLNDHLSLYFWSEISLSCITIRYNYVMCVKAQLPHKEKKC